MSGAAVPTVPEAGANPFSARAALLLMVGGTLLFVALLWMIGAGLTGGSTNDGGAHAGGRGLNGYAGFAEYLERRGFTVRLARSADALTSPGLLVLTPPARADGKALAGIVERRRQIGPTLVITPKWAASPLPSGTPGARQGWAALSGVAPVEWPGFLDQVSLKLAGVRDARWDLAELEGRLPAPGAVFSGTGEGLVPLVTGEGGRILAAYVADGGYYPGLADLAGRPTAAGDEGRFPVIIIFEPDLLDNFGLRDAAAARLGERLVRSTGASAVTFDLTLNGFARARNLLTLAFTPPFLAATLCLLMAAAAAGWRNLVRFGAPRRPERAIAFGKRALVANAAGLIGRTERLHLLTEPYAAASRERLARALALPRLPAAAIEAAIDRALAQRRADAPRFSEVAARLAAARRPGELLAAAQALHALERMLKR